MFRQSLARVWGRFREDLDKDLEKGSGKDLDKGKDLGNDVNGCMEFRRSSLDTQILDFLSFSVF